MRIIITVVNAVLNMRQFWFLKCSNAPKDPDGMANSVDPDQTAPKEQSDLVLHFLLRPICPNT